MNSNTDANLAALVNTYRGADVRTSLRTRVARRTLTGALISARIDRAHQLRNARRA